MYAQRYKIVSDDLAKCISIEDDNPKSGATVVLWGYEAHETQHWRFERYPGTVRIVNCASGLCLEPTAGRQIVLAKIENYSDEDWWILTAPALDV